MAPHLVTRRQFTRAMVGSLAAVATVRGRADAADELVIVGWGGTHEESLKKAVYDPFTAETGIRIKQVSVTNQLPMLKAQVQNNSPEWDIIQPGSLWVHRGAKEGLFENVDYGVVDKSQLYAQSVHPNAVAFEVFAVDICYATDKYPTGSHPKTFADLWDQKRFPGRRTAPGWTPRDNIEAAVLAAGVPVSKVYPIDTKLAFDKLKEFKPNTVWYNTGAQFAQLFADKEVVLGYGWGARIVVVAREGKPLAVELNQAIVDQTFYAVSKISKNKANAMKFINFAVQAKPQLARPALYPHGPINKRAWEQIDQKARRDLVNFELPNIVTRDAEWWVDREDDLTRQWKAFLAS